MNNFCAFSKNHTCINWMNYIITQQELEEANSLCHENWLEIERQFQYIQTLQKLLDEHHISYPHEF